MERTEAMAIAELLDYTRGLTKWYISKLSEDRVTECLVIDGYTMHSAYWLVAHLSWAEYSISRSIGGPKLDVGWLQEFRISSPHTTHQDHWVPFSELKQIMDNIHESTIPFVKSIDDGTLDDIHPNPDVHFIFKTRRQALFHISRHEGYHTGQLGLIAKVHGAKTA